MIGFAATMSTPTVLLVEGDGSLRETLEQVIGAKRRCRFECAADLVDAAARIRRGGIALAIVYHAASSDVGDTSRVLREASSHQPVSVPTVVVLDADDIDLTLRFLKLGAVECLCRPIRLHRLSLLVGLLTVHQLCAEPKSSDEDSPTESGCIERADHPFYFRSPAMLDLMDQVRMVARLETTVLLTGETGTGKTLLARGIHRMSPHRANPFLTVSCASLSTSLIESELFGHVRGAFTGADRNHVGKLAKSRKGTLLLDDIDATTADVQAKLLRVVDERVFEPVGATASKRFEARLVATTNKSLETEVDQGRFRADLLYRLNVATFHLPPLRERPDEIEFLAKRFADGIARHHGLREPRGFTEGAVRALRTYHWPGNIRELHNIVERALIQSRGDTIGEDLLPREWRQPASGDHEARSTGFAPSDKPLAKARADGERDRLIRVLEQNDGNRSRTAAQLGVSRAALYKKLHKYGLM
jgi:DNA-binding NtrC family response regulator